MAKQLKSLDDFRINMTVNVIPNYEFIVDEWIDTVVAAGDGYAILRGEDGVLREYTEASFRKNTFWDESPSTDEWLNADWGIPEYDRCDAD